MVLQGSMHIPILLLFFTTLEARKQRTQSTSPLPTNLDKIVDINDDTFDRPVDFLHVYREGVGDKDYKPPINLLELDMIKPRNKEHAMELLKKTKKQNIQWMPKDLPLVFNSPRDEYLYYKKMHETSKNDTTSRTKSHSYDFLRVLETNLQYPAVESRNNMEVKNNSRELVDKSRFEPRENISDLFSENAFFLKRNRRKINWTTCDEFSVKALFHSPDILDTKWLPFYIWSKRYFSIAVVHSFSYPTKKRVVYYKKSFGPYVKDIDWTMPKLLLKERREILLISSDTNGFFYGIPDQVVPTPEEGNVTLPTMKLRIKIHSPYIAMMYCDEFYSTIMAELGTEPITNGDKIREASTLGFRGIGVPAYRDLEGEKISANMEKLRKLEAEERKTIKIRRIIGDVDDAVRH